MQANSGPSLEINIFPLFHNVMGKKIENPSAKNDSS
jgi:hypothetical protein